MLFHYYAVEAFYKELSWRPATLSCQSSDVSSGRRARCCEKGPRICRLQQPCARSSSRHKVCLCFRAYLVVPADTLLRLILDRPDFYHTLLSLDEDDIRSWRQLHQ